LREEIRAWAEQVAHDAGLIRNKTLTDLDQMRRFLGNTSESDLSWSYHVRIALELRRVL